MAGLPKANGWLIRSRTATGKIQLSYVGVGPMAQMLVIQLRVVTVQAAPPAAHAAAGLPHGEKGIEDNTIHAIVDPLQQLGVVLRKVIGLCGHARWLARFAAVSTSCSRSEPPFSSEIWKR